MVYMYKYLKDVIFELFVSASQSAAKFSSSKISLAKLWLASIGEQDTSDYVSHLQRMMASFDFTRNYCALHYLCYG